MSACYQIYSNLQRVFPLTVDSLLSPGTLSLTFVILINYNLKFLPKTRIRSGISAGYNSARAHDHRVRVKSVDSAKIECGTQQFFITTFQPLKWRALIPLHGTLLLIRSGREILFKAVP